MKRAIDILAAALALPFVAPITLLLAIAIRIESDGNPIFLQERVGRHERPFTLIKLRTMHTGTRDQPTHEVSASEVTRVGGFLRSSKLDEIPQFWNVLKGDMSLVGPRPCLPTQSELIAHRRTAGVFKVRPGITGPAQLAGIDMSRPKELADADAAYEPSVLLDLRYIAETIVGRGTGDRISVD